MDGSRGAIRHKAESSRHIAGSDVTLEISTNNLYADIGGRSRFAGLPVRNNKDSHLRTAPPSSWYVHLTPLNATLPIGICNTCSDIKNTTIIIQLLYYIEFQFIE